ncbi:hypothetical protein BO78DRAFT_397332 [Aspergillus terreus]|uniref:Uncharacterized protein n=1 Tax=Aspergillus terreus TaxID=33178 RepID=A0A5M3Z8A3_ASPTE|nr:hypothetical protein ATETN484_0011035000 [Aspergillus terreus]GFF18992.1 hypothetical protein BO78DRAFT_397332 [Aspergillus terreus]
MDASSTSLIICSTRDSFLDKTRAACVHLEDTVGSCQLFTKTIGLLSKSSRVKVAFCPTLEHLRAYLSSLRLTDRAFQDVAAEGERSSRPLVAILDPLALHVPTSEFSAQGLSRTFAAAVEATSGEATDLILCESRDVSNPTENSSGEALWYVDVPLLNSSVRMGGQNVPVKRIAQRWFEFKEYRNTIDETPEI